MLRFAVSRSLYEANLAWKVAWTRGNGCQPLAEALAPQPTGPLKADLEQSCIDNRIDVLVARRLTSFDLVPVVVPTGVDLAQVTAVTAAVSDGPHSELAAAVAARIATSLHVPGELATLYRSDKDESDAEDRLERLGESRPVLQRRSIGSRTAAALVETLTPTTLLVLGAPGGSWLQRQFFGHGHRLTVAAPGGSVVVRSAPRRCFHMARDATGNAVGPHLSVVEARRLFSDPVVAVADEGKLVGIVRLDTLDATAAEQTVGDVMEPPVSVDATEPLEVAEEIGDELNGSPIPVVDNAGMLVGTIVLDD